MTGSNDRCRRDQVLIELNNRALQILQYGFCRLSIDTYKDALELMKTSAAEANTTSHHHYFANLLDRAEQRRHTAETANTNSLSEAPNGLLIFSSHDDATQVYHILATARTSKVALTMRIDDDTLVFPTIKAIMVYNYGIAHRCCTVTANTMQNFCLQIFQYAETLTPKSWPNLLFRMLLTRNLMLLSCRLGMSLCEHYKETLDPIEREIVGPLDGPEDVPHEAAAA